MLSGHARIAKAQIRLRVCAVWSEPSLSANIIIGYNRMYQWRTKTRMRSESAHFALVSRRVRLAWPKLIVYWPNTSEVTKTNPHLWSRVSWRQNRKTGTEWSSLQCITNDKYVLCVRKFENKNKLSQRTTQSTTRLVRPAKTQISLHICAVWPVLADGKCLLQPPGYPTRDEREPSPSWVEAQADLFLLVTEVLL